MKTYVGETNLITYPAKLNIALGTIMKCIPHHLAKEGGMLIMSIVTMLVSRHVVTIETVKTVTPSLSLSFFVINLRWLKYDLSRFTE